MQIADIRRQFADHFAVGPQHQPQHAVRAGMLGAHVDQHFVAAEVEFDQIGIDAFNRHFRSSWQCRDIRAAGDNPCAADGRSSPRAAGSASRSGWPTKLTPIRSKTSRSCQLAVFQTEVSVGSSGRRPGTSSCQRGSVDHKHQAMLMDEARKVIEHFQVRLPLDGGRLFRVGLEVIDARNAMQHVEPQGRLVAQARARSPAASRRPLRSRDRSPRAPRGGWPDQSGRSVAGEYLRIASKVY